ncbi:hypothetical protein ACHAXT_004592 [Thalassiosira profunda]
MSTTPDLPPLPPPANGEITQASWDLAFSPPKHDFDPEQRRKTPPRFLGKKKKPAGVFRGTPAEGNAAPGAAAPAPAAAGGGLGDEEPYPIKFSLSHDIRDDGSFSEYLKDSLMGASPRASPRGSPRGSPSLGGSMSFGMFVDGAETFDFESTANGFPLPKLQMSPMSTPPRKGLKLSPVELKPESPPAINKPLGKDGVPKLPPPRFPAELVHSPHRPPYAGPTQHQSPGQTIYNVPSKSVGSPPSPYQPSYNWQPPASHPASHSTPRAVSQVVGQEGAETSPEFNPPRSHLRGQSRSHAGTTITARNGDAVKEEDGKLDPVTPSPGHHIRQAVSDESHSPALAPMVHQPWAGSESLPPHVAQSNPQAWGGHNIMPPAMPIGSGYPSPHAPGGYYSPYYQHGGPKATPDPAPSGGGDVQSNDPTAMSEQAQWKKHQHLLHQFLLQFGHCDVPQGYGVGTHYGTLHDWCNEQRSQYQRMQRNIHREADASAGDDDGGNGPMEPCTMTPTRSRALTQMGFVWGLPPSGFPSQRSGARRSGPAPSITSHGAKNHSSWNNWMRLLKDYKSKFGDCEVPLKYEANPSLGTFVNRQRAEFKKMRMGKPSSMTPERCDDLERLGFTWAMRDSHTSWNDRFKELKQFRTENGHCNVPKVYGKNPSLGYWVNEQRFQYRRLLKKKPSYMTREKVDKLNGLDFKWSLRETNGSWDNWLKELREYLAQHGDVDVPLKYRPNPALGAFVNRQRTEYRKLQQGLQTSLTEERMRDLGELGFKWAIRVSRTPWDTRLEELKQFKEQHGHCNVPSTYPKNQPLAYWVFKQRGQFRIYKKRNYPLAPGERRQMCHMTPERIAKLDSVGFEWNPARRLK